MSAPRLISYPALSAPFSLGVVVGGPLFSVSSCVSAYFARWDIPRAAQASPGRRLRLSAFFSVYVQVRNLSFLDISTLCHFNQSVLVFSVAQNSIFDIRTGRSQISEIIRGDRSFSALFHGRGDEPGDSTLFRRIGGP